MESRFDTEYVLNQQCTVDEAMIPFKGRLGFKQYMHQASEVGDKGLGFSRCKKNGYVKNLQIHTGRDESGKVLLDYVQGLS